MRQEPQIHWLFYFLAFDAIHMRRRAITLLGTRLQKLTQPDASHTTAGLTTIAPFGLGSRGSIVKRGALAQTRSHVMPAQNIVEQPKPSSIPLTEVNAVGAISIVQPHEKDFVPKAFENVDGRRIEDGRYAAFTKEITGMLIVVHPPC